MAKRIQIDDQFFRIRRGVLVEIPKQWIGHTLTPQTKRKRQSKQIRKVKNMGFSKNFRREIGLGSDRYLRYKRGEDVFNEVNYREIENE